MTFGSIDLMAYCSNASLELTFNGYSSVQNLELKAMIVTENGVEFSGTLYKE